MARVKKGSTVHHEPPQYDTPARTPQEQEDRMIALAVQCAEEQMRNGTASSQIICHYLKLGSEREGLEREKLRCENDMLQAKAESLRAAKATDEKYQAVLDAMTRYTGGY